MEIFYPVDEVLYYLRGTKGYEKLTSNRQYISEGEFDSVLVLYNEY